MRSYHQLLRGRPRTAASRSLSPLLVSRLLVSRLLASPLLVALLVAPPVPAPRSPPVKAPAAVTAYRWPLDGVPRPVRRFDPPPQPWLAGHRGVDLATGANAVVRSAGPGVVLFAGWIAGRPVISVSHAAGLRTTYEPVRPQVRAGDRVTGGDPIGVLLPDHAGCPAQAASGSGVAAGACLHWGLRRGDEYLDPLALLGLGRVRLLPIRSSETDRAGVAPESGGAGEKGG